MHTDDMAGFLLARIAEDEVLARAEIERLRGAARRGGKATAARHLAECEAKRQIITRYEFARDQADSHAVNRSEDDGWEKIAGALVLCCRSLALPYADHPDYREEWRP